MARWCFRPCTARFTLAIELLLPSREHDAVSASRRDPGPPWAWSTVVPGWHDGTPPFLQPDQPPHLGAVAPGDLGLAREPPGPLAGLLLEDVGAEGLAPHDPAGAGHLEPLGRTPVRLHLGHQLAVAFSLGLARLSGASTMIMFRPSSRGAASTLAGGASCSAMRSRIFLPNSGRAISRPLNMMVIFTL